LTLVLFSKNPIIHYENYENFFPQKILYKNVKRTLNPSNMPVSTTQGHTIVVLIGDLSSFNSIERF